jgi:glycerol uptake facilitator-like aquaporin
VSARTFTSEFLGTAFLLAAVVGSGIMAERLSTDAGLQLLQNAFATAAVLTALILALQHASGAHFNPAVTLAALLFRETDRRTAIGYVVAQLLGGVTGVAAANLMFERAAIEVSTNGRDGLHLAFAEGVATFGLLLVIYGVVRRGRPELAAYSVGGYVAGAIYFTSSTCFANPSVTISRMFSDTYTGIAPHSVLPFLGAQVVATVAAVAVLRVLYPVASSD